MTNFWDGVIGWASNVPGILDEGHNGPVDLRTNIPLVSFMTDEESEDWNSIEPSLGLLEEREDLQDSESSSDNASLASARSDEYFGTIHSDVVQYMTGKVSENEMVTLVREPHNLFDQYSVRVENSSLQQVGYIESRHAQALSYIMDSGIARVEGVIPSYGAHNNLGIPVDIHFSGAPEKKTEVLEALRSFGLTMSISKDRDRATRAEAILEDSSTSLTFPLPMDYTHVVSSRTFVSEQEMQNEMDKMFETLDEGDKTTEAQPDKAIARKLYPHQKQALNWMICKENEENMPPFWGKKNNMYVNSLTKHRTSVKPRSVCGGILADDMGLGKTLEMIALIMTNSVDGKPLCKFFPGLRRAPLKFLGKNSSRSVFRRKQSGGKKKAGDPESPCPPTPHSTSTDSTRLPPIPTVILQPEHATDSEGVRNSSDKCHEENRSAIVFENSHMSPASSAAQRGTVKRSTWYTHDGDVDEEEEAYQPARKKARDFTEQNVDMNLCSNNTVRLMGEEVTESQTEWMSTESLSPRNTSSYTVECEPISPDPLPSTVKDMNNSTGYSWMQTGQDSSQDSSLHSVINVEELSNDEAPIVIEDSDDELPDLPSLCSKESSDDSPEPQPDCDSSRHISYPYPSPSRATLIICPVSVISNWVEQFEEHIDKTVHLQLYVYYGPNRTKDADFLRDQDVVITTYSILATDSKNMNESPLHDIEWLRIVLDEGHEIRNPTAKRSKAIYELRAERRWVLTGTPIQNSMKDFWSLLNFLQVEPFTDRHWWNRTISQPLVRRETAALKRVAHLMGNLALRRTKNQQLHGKPLVELPARQVYLEKITLSQEEREVYDAMQKEGKVIISRYFRQGTLLRNYGKVLNILLRLRQLCCHPRLLAKAVNKSVEATQDSEATDSTAESSELNEEDRKKLIDQLTDVLNSGSDEECPICMESLKDPVITVCAHIYCRACIETVIEKEQPQAVCPLCRGSIDKSRLLDPPPPEEIDKGDEPEDESTEEWNSSAKVDALMKALNELRQQDPQVKSVVVSQFTSLLTVLETPLALQGFVFSRLDGTMNVKERSRALEKFADPQPGSPTIFLLSLKAGGVGINLTAASRVFLMDPAWNPAAEDQCFDRCHRLGQTKDVIITRFVIENSVEERMLALQDKKRQLMNGAFAKKKLTASEVRDNRINDIRRLIDI